MTVTTIVQQFDEQCADAALLATAEISVETSNGRCQTFAALVQELEEDVSCCFD